MMTSSTTLFLFSQMSGMGAYWKNFLEYWRRIIVTENGIVVCTLLLGAVGIFIITRGKWTK